jgi:uncharacterized protein
LWWGFEKRPTRPARLLEKYPVSEKEYLSPVDKHKFKEILEKYKDVAPGKR